MLSVISQTEKDKDNRISLTVESKKQNKGINKQTKKAESDYKHQEQTGHCQWGGEWVMGKMG